MTKKLKISTFSIFVPGVDTDLLEVQIGGKTCFLVPNGPQDRVFDTSAAAFGGLRCLGGPWEGPSGAPGARPEVKKSKILRHF